MSDHKLPPCDHDCCPHTECVVAGRDRLRAINAELLEVARELITAEDATIAKGKEWPGGHYEVKLAVRRIEAMEALRAAIAKTEGE